MIGPRGRLLLATITILCGGVTAATTSDAAVGPDCFGDSNEAVCVTVDPSALPAVDPTGGPGIHDCIFVGPPPCMPVDVPTPLVTSGSGSSLVDVQCTGIVSPCPGNVALVGTGTIWPGLTTNPGPPQTFNLVATGFGVAGGEPGQFNCAFVGNDVIGTITQGAGTLNGSCATPCGSVTVGGSYTRNLTVATVSGGVTAGCLAPSTFAGACAFIPTSPPPVTNFSLTCDLTFP